MNSFLLYIFRFAVIVALAVPLLSATGFNRALAATTDWQDLGGGKVRLVTNYDPIVDEIEGIIEVKLQPGWMTYWRNPGESGIPPNFDFSGSKGMIISEPRYPVPQIKKYAGIVSIGYQNTVAFPFRAKPITSPISGEVKLNLSIGVCAEICIPAVAVMVQKVDELNRSDFRATKLIKAAKLTIPQPQEESDTGLKITSARFDGNSKILVETIAPKNIEKLQLLAEGRKNWYIAPAILVLTKDESNSFAIDVSTIPGSANIADVPIKFTLSYRNKGIEKSIQLIDKL